MPACGLDAVQCSQFWWNWWINAAVAAGTLLAVLVAIFGDWLKSKLFRPRLDVVMLDGGGTLSTTKLPDESGKKSEHQTRWYHLRVLNRTRWPIATHVQVNLLRIEQLEYDGSWQEVWKGLMPIRWRFQEAQPITRSVGPSADCDALRVIKDKYLQLMLFFDIPSIPTQYKDSVSLRISVQAIAAESESPLRKFQISWTGKWGDSDEEMNENLTISTIE